MFLLFHKKQKRGKEGKKKKDLGFQPTPKLRSSLLVLVINKPVSRLA